MTPTTRTCTATTTPGAWNSKLANLHFALGLQDAFEGAGVDAMSLAAHPGLTNSDLQARTVREGGGGFLGPFFHRLTSLTGMSTAQGALLLRCAPPPIRGPAREPASRFGNSGPAVRRLLVRPGSERAIEVLWEVSSGETGVPLVVA
ncbi:MAG: hypothetical protein R2716_04635 [Microthrixaceae bacterium]